MAITTIAIRYNLAGDLADRTSWSEPEVLDTTATGVLRELPVGAAPAAREAIAGDRC
jgi:hypothetical protein